MAFPSVASTATTSGTTATTSAVVNLPASITAGQSLLVLIRSSAGGATTFPAGWTKIVDDDSDASDGSDRTALAWRRADGTEGATITVTLGNSGRFAAIAWRITGARNPELSPPEVSNVTTGVSTSPNPGSLTPTGGAQDYLWFWMGGWEGIQTSPPASNPVNYSSDILGADSGTIGGIVGNVRVASATRQLNATTEDPGSWTISSSDDWTAVTVAIYPEVTSEELVEKDLGYVVLEPNTIPLGVDYTVETSDTETKGINYDVQLTPTFEKGLEYRLPPSVAPARVSYHVIIKDSSGELHEFEKFSSLSYELYENDVGVCRFLLPYSDSKMTPDSVEAGKGIIRIYREGVLVWQGFVSVIDDNKDGSTIYGFDFKETLKWSRIGFRVTTSGSTTPSSDYFLGTVGVQGGNVFDEERIGSGIISRIWDVIAARTNPFIGGVIQKGTIQNPNVVGSDTTRKVISRTVADEDFFSFLQEMVAVSRADSPSGSWKQDTVFDISLEEDTPTFTFLRDVGTDKPDVRLELDSEITNFTLTEDASGIRNSIRGLTVTDAPKVLTTTQTDTASSTAYYLRDIGIVFPSADKQSALVEKAKDYLKEKKDVRKDVAVEFASGLKPFDGYQMGDGVKIVVNRGRVAIDEFYRVVGMRVSYEAGIELTVPILRRKRT